MTRFLATGFVTFVLLVASGGPVRAQATAELNGRVTDEGGAVLPGVTVTATQTDTGFTRSIVSDGEGGYAMPSLPVGPYRLEMSLQGFRPYVRTGIVLQVGGAPTINARLAVGGIEETVSVDAAAPLVDVRSAGISDVVDEDRIVELPLQGRQVTDLITLAGAAVELGRPNNRNFQGGVNISVAGGATNGIAYSLDGAMHNDVQNAGGLPLPFPDALQEFSVATGGLTAQTGMQSGAAVNAVTKSGANRFSGVAFEFLRDRRFNATNPFAAVGPDGERQDDGLRRHQYGGTLGGPVMRDRVFFFGGFQATRTRVEPADNLAYVPTAAMLAGDFTAFASPACNSGRQVTLGGGFVNNRIDPARFSPAAVKLANMLPTTANPCGETRFGLPNDRDEWQAIGRLDYQRGGTHSVFGRYMATSDEQPSGYGQTGNLLTLTVPNIDNLAQSLTVGDTLVLGAKAVNSVRFAYNRTWVNRFNEPFVGPADLGIKLYSYSRGREMQVAVTDGFTLSGNAGSRGLAENHAFQVSDDLTLVRGSHQIAFGGNLAYWDTRQETFNRAGGQWTFNGQATGLGLADFLLGRAATLQHGTATGVTLEQWYWGAYVQDAWRVSNRVTLNAGVRWEPFFGQTILNGAVPNFSLEDFRQGVRSGVFRNTPAGLRYEGDPGYPGKSGFEAEWWNLSPRAGVAWDVLGDGRLALRSSYGLAYSIPTGDTWFIPGAAPPYGYRANITDPPGLFDDPFGHLGGDPSPVSVGPDAPFPLFSQLGAIDPDIGAPRIQSWNVTVEQQIGADWGVSASYLGNYSDRLWLVRPANPGVFLGLGPCTLDGVSSRVCTTNANLNVRRSLYLENRAEGQYFSNLNEFVDEGAHSYRGLKLSIRRRAAAGVSISGNYTLSRCYGLESNGTMFTAGYTNPDDPDFDRGHCNSDRRHLANLTGGAQTPEFVSPLVRVLASNWRASGILSARSGNWLTVTTGRDTAFNGQGNQRVNQLSDDVYSERTLNSYLNRAAFAAPEPGMFGNHEVNSIRGPGFWKVDVAVSRLFMFGTAQTLEVRVEAFNVFNRFNWGDPITNFASGNFGRIQSAAGDPRIMQFGVKYGF